MGNRGVGAALAAFKEGEGMKKQPKRLYKAFHIMYRGEREVLVGPFSHKQYRSEKGTRLTLGNAIGFTSRPVKGRLERCVNGYHAGTLRRWHKAKSFKSWIVKTQAGKWGSSSDVLFEVKLLKPAKSDYDGNKEVGRKFRIIKEVARR